LVYVRNDALRVGRHESIDIRFNQRAGIEVLIA
jgi:hypothetical protein